MFLGQANALLEVLLLSSYGLVEFLEVKRIVRLSSILDPLLQDFNEEKDDVLFVLVLRDDTFGGAGVTAHGRV